MKSNNKIAVVLAAGFGTRMVSNIPKVVHRLAGRPMLLYVLDAINGAGIDRIIVVVGPGMDNIKGIVLDSYPNVEFTIQKERLGTGHAVMAAKKLIGKAKGPVIIVYGDTPLLEVETVKNLITTFEGDHKSAIGVLGFESYNPGDYGRLIKDKSGNLKKIVEAREASEKEREVTLCNSGIFAVDGELLAILLQRISNNNSKGEYYLTDIVEVAVSAKHRCIVVEGKSSELIGVNSRLDLSVSEALVQERLRERVMERGVTLLDPSTVYFSWDTYIGRDSIIGPNVFFGEGVKLGENVEIRAFSHIEHSKIASGAVVGPFARLRVGTTLGRGVHIGNFVEIKNSKISDGVKASHLSYIGDAMIGKNSNVGAGTITCNFDGIKKSKTHIGEGVLIGSNTALVAPVKIGNNAATGAGSVITRDLKDGALGIARAEQKDVLGWSEKRNKSKSKD